MAAVRKAQPAQQWADLVKVTRARLGMSRSKFAQLMGGIDCTTLWAWESGNRAPAAPARVLIMQLQDPKNLTRVRRAAAEASVIDAA